MRTFRSDAAASGGYAVGREEFDTMELWRRRKRVVVRCCTAKTPNAIALIAYEGSTDLRDVHGSNCSNAACLFPKFLSLSELRSIHRLGFSHFRQCNKMQMPHAHECEIPFCDRLYDGRQLPICLISELVYFYQLP